MRKRIARPPPPASPPAAWVAPVSVIALPVSTGARARPEVQGALAMAKHLEKATRLADAMADPSLPLIVFE